MRLAKLSRLALLPVLALAPALFAAPKQKPVHVQFLRGTSLQQAHTLQSKPEFSLNLRPHEMLKQMPKPRLRSNSPMAIPRISTDSLAVGGYSVVGPDKPFYGFDGLDSTDSGQVVGFVVEPPDQGMGTNGSQVFEAVNLALQVFDNGGKPLVPPTSAYAFFGVSQNPDAQGNTENLSDPRVFYDWQTGRWFVTILEYASTSKGSLTGGSSVLIAVSSGWNPVTSHYNVYSIDVSDAGFGACPCLGDQPLLGSNQDGIFLNTNEFSDATGYFQTPLVTALSKKELIEGGHTINGAAFDGMDYLAGGFSLQPSFTSPYTSTSLNYGTEFFTSSLDPYGIGDNRVSVWALTNTESLNNRVANLNLLQKVIATEEYTEPVPATQRAGSYPLGMSLGDAEGELDPGDNRMQQMFYANGILYCALTTSLFDPTGQSGPRAGIAWFAIRPNASYSALWPQVVHQGYIGAKNANVIYPAFAVNKWGDGAIGFTLSGSSFFPSTAYVHYDNGWVPPYIHLAGNGQAPDDGFSIYPQFGGSGVGRWGDYGAAMVTPSGHLWVAGEYIPNTYSRPRTTYTNWGTFISYVQ